jgi:hypothetical protein
VNNTNKGISANVQQKIYLHIVLDGKKGMNAFEDLKLFYCFPFVGVIHQQTNYLVNPHIAFSCA